uniref:Uncharacterized protein n=1 Tax=Oryza brachyantha TaxID=4533 RepID=J3M3G0_ORYBR
MPRYDDRYGNTRLYVGRLSSRTRSRDLEYLFSRYGRIREVELKRDYAFIEFSDSRDAEDARYNLDGRDVDGSRILVEFAKGVPRGPGGSREYMGRGPPPGTGRCFNCGIDGHWARDCKAGAREVIRAPHRHAVDVVAVGAIAEAGAGAGVTASLGPGPCLDPRGDAEIVMIGDQGVLATAEVQGDLSLLQQMRRSAAAPLMVVGAQGVHGTV